MHQNSNYKEIGNPKYILFLSSIKLVIKQLFFREEFEWHINIVGY